MTPDSKDWTWVLDRTCRECDVDSAAHDPAVTGSVLRECARRWSAALTRPNVRERPDPRTWSPLEYGCHVRDVLRLYDERLQLMLLQDDPLYANWDQDATAVEQRYADQDPQTVATEIATATGPLADRFDGLSGNQWQRTGRRSDGASFTVTTFAQYFLHDVLHHLHDVKG